MPYTPPPPDDPLTVRGQSLTPQSPMPNLLPPAASIPLLNGQADLALLSHSLIDKEQGLTGSNSAHVAPTPASLDLQAPYVGRETFLADDANSSKVTNAHSPPSHRKLSENTENFEILEVTSPDSTLAVASKFHSKSAVPGSFPAVDNHQPSTFSDSRTTPPTTLNTVDIELNASLLPSISSPMPAGNVDLDQILHSIVSQSRPPTVPQAVPTSSAEQTNRNGMSAVDTSAAAAKIPVSPPSLKSPPVNSDVDAAASFIPLSPSHSQQTMSAAQLSHKPAQSPRIQSAGSTAPLAPDDGQFPPQFEKAYQQFLQEEAKNVAEGKWERFPEGSRLFIRNLDTEKAHKRDVFRKFYPYGMLAQISMKQTYGFVQFMDAAACSSARDMEQGTCLPQHGRKVHLEVSRPQPKSSGKDRANNQRRSRSPRGDRYTGGGNGNSSGASNRRTRDDYRPSGNPRGRSPSPRGRHHRRGPDLYDGRARTRSRSPLPQRFSRRDDPDDIDSLLPRRAPRDVPDVQIIVVDNADRDYIARIGNALRRHGISTDIMYPYARIPEETIIKRQILEGVTGVIKLGRIHQMAQDLRIPLLIFDQSEGASEVQYRAYVDLEPLAVAGLVHEAKERRRGLYNPPNTGYNRRETIQYTPADYPRLSLPSPIDARPELQNLLASSQNNTHNYATTQQPAFDLARLLAQATSTSPSSVVQPAQSQTQLQVGYDSHIPANLASLLASSSTNVISNPQLPTQPGAQQIVPTGEFQMQQFIAQLSNYRP